MTEDNWNEKMASALVAAKQLSETEKKQSLAEVLFNKIDEIEENKKHGVSYTKMAELAGIDKHIFITALNRAKKKKQKLVNQKNINSETKNRTIIKQNDLVVKDDIKDQGSQEDKPKRAGPKILTTNTSSAFEENLKLKHLNISSDDE